MKEINTEGGWNNFWGLKYMGKPPSALSASLNDKVTRVVEGRWHYKWQDLFSPDGKYTISFDYTKQKRLEKEGKSTAKIQNLETGEAISLDPRIWLIAKFSPVNDILLNSIRTPDSRLVDNKILLRDFSGNHLAEFKSGKLRDAYFSADGQQIITIPILPKSPIKIWNLQGDLIEKIYLKTSNQKPGETFTSSPIKFINNTADKLLDKFTENEVGLLTPGINQIIFNPQGQYFLAPDNEYGSITLWDMEGNVTGRMEGQPGWFIDIQTSSDGERIATLAHDQKIRIWNRNAQQIGEYNGYAMTFNEDWSRIAVASSEDSTITVWPMDNLEGLLQRSCDWLSVYMRTGPASKADQKICKPYL